MIEIMARWSSMSLVRAGKRRVAFCAALLALGALGAVYPAAQESGPSRFQTVTVKPGDTLWAIANTYLKDPTRWNEILKYNHLPSSDPTVALPGMTLKVPVALIKEELRAAGLIEMSNSVLFRKKDKADWNPAALGMQLYRNDGLRTLASSSAKVRFVGGDILSLDQNSMAILKPLNKNFDLELIRGEIQATHAKVVTASARITPKNRDTKYSARVKDDLSTRVEVYSGTAEVEGGGMTVEVQAGFASEVPVDRSPSVPTRLPELPQFAAGAADAGAAPKAAISTRDLRDPNLRATAGAPDIRQLGSDLESIKVRLGAPISGYHVQASRTRDFGRVIFDKIFDVDEAVDLNGAGLPRGSYWLRAAVVDLLGAENKFSEPKEYFKR